jgi:ribosomal protein S18 acetylase RimI-like enzyme
VTDADPLDRIDAYLDAVPRTSADAVSVGAFTLFVPRDSPWPYYARPARARAADPTAEDVVAVRSEQRRRALPETFEWVHQTAPDLAGVLAAQGLPVVLHPLLVLRDPRAATAATSPQVRVLGPDDPAVAGAAAVAALGFAEPGTDRGPAGPAERDAALRARPADADDHVRDRIARGLTVVAVAEDADGVLAAGSHQPVGPASEIVGVATLPAARRRGLAAAVTAALVNDAQARGADLVLLSASDDDVARVYERTGFVRVGHAGAVEPG